MSDSLKIPDRDRERDLVTGFDPPPADFIPSTPGVLLSDEIERHVRAYKLIYDFSKDQLKPAAYELRVGDAASVGGATRALRGDDSIIIEPFEVAIIQTYERLNMPRNLIARWNLRVHWAYEGLLWVGAAQVDPGYRGFLFCPIYNLSNTPVTLSRGKSIAVIDFVTTTPVTDDSLKYSQQKRFVLSDYSPEKLRSALATEARDKIASFETRLGQIQARVDQFTAITFAALAIIVGALSALAGHVPEYSLWNVGFALAAFSLLVQLFSSYVIRSEVHYLAGALKGPAATLKAWWMGRFVSVGIFAAVAAAGFILAWSVYDFGKPGLRLSTLEAEQRTDKRQLDELTQKFGTTRVKPKAGPGAARS